MDNLKIQGETPMNEIILCKLGEVYRFVDYVNTALL